MKKSATVFFAFYGFFLKIFPVFAIIHLKARDFPEKGGSSVPLRRRNIICITAVCLAVLLCCAACPAVFAAGQTPADAAALSGKAIRMSEETALLCNGGYTRTLTLWFSGKDPQSEKALELLRPLAPNGHEDTAETVWENGQIGCRFSFGADDPAELKEKTDFLLKTENPFTVTATPDKARAGYAALSVSQTVDGSFYLSDSATVSHSLTAYRNTVLTEEAGETVQWENGSALWESGSREERTLCFDWQITFRAVRLKASSEQPGQMKLRLIFTLPEDFSEQIKQTAVGRIQALAEAGGEFEESENQCDVLFSGTPQEVTKQINAFVGAAECAGETPFSVRLARFSPRVSAHSGMRGVLHYDFSPVIGACDLLVSDETTLTRDGYYGGLLSVNEDGNRVSPAAGELIFYDVRLPLYPVLLLIFGMLLLTAGIFCLLWLLCAAFRKKSFSALRKFLVPLCAVLIAGVVTVVISLTAQRTDPALPPLAVNSLPPELREALQAAGVPDDSGALRQVKPVGHLQAGDGTDVIVCAVFEREGIVTTLTVEYIPAR